MSLYIIQEALKRLLSDDDFNQAQTVLFFCFALDFYKKKGKTQQTPLYYLHYHMEETNLEPVEVVETVEEVVEDTMEEVAEKSDE